MNGIAIEHLSKSFKDVIALNDVSMNLEAGKIYALLGRNGAGKTTLLNLITNRIFAQEGTIKINDSLSTQEESQKQLFLTNAYSMYPDSFRVRDVFDVANLFYGNFNYEYADDLCTRFQLDKKRKLTALSTGYQSVYKLITGLCVDASYVFFDEPVLGLDANHRNLFYKELIKCFTKKPRTYVISTHLIEEISDIVEEVIIINEGRVIEKNSVEELLNNGYSISGKSSDVDAFCKDKKVLGYETLGTYKVAFIYGKRPKNLEQQNLDVGRLDLQKLFIAMTAKEGESYEII